MRAEPGGVPAEVEDVDEEPDDVGLDPEADGGPGRVDRLLAVRGSRTFTFATMLVSALISLTASFVLSIDAMLIAENFDVVLACDINAVISCGDVARSWQAQLLGFPNAFLGLVAEPVIITIAVASLGGVRFPRWFMISAQTVYTIGLGFAYWLFYESFVNIGSLCPWCLLVTLSTTLVFSTMTRINVMDGHLPMPRAWRGPVRRFYAQHLDLPVVVLVLCTLAALIVIKYGAVIFG